MIKRFTLVFDEVMKQKLAEAITKANCREVIKQWLDRLEQLGPDAGKLLDNHVWLYEMKSKHPPLRLYYHYSKTAEKIVLFELEMKTSEKKQQKTINRLHHNLNP
ncbi:MAG: hypothetical protein AABX04_07505 [Nanoarchaeota archaeon]|mgnify:FL=1